MTYWQLMMRLTAEQTQAVTESTGIYDLKLTDATDGAVELNQTCAVQTGCLADDAAGFPVTIATPGSYRLTAPSFSQS